MVDKISLLENAQKYYQAGAYENSLRVCLQILESDPADIRIRHKVAELYLKCGDVEHSTAELITVSNSYIEQKSYLKAISILKQALAISETRPDLHSTIGNLYILIDSLAEGIYHLRKAAELYESSEKIYHARIIYEHLISLDSNIELKQKLADLLLKEGNPAKASEIYIFILKQSRQNVSMDKQIEIYEKLAICLPNVMEYHQELARIYLQKKDFKKALQKLQLCFNQKTTDLPTLYLLAQTFEALEQPGKALSVYKEITRFYIQNDNIPKIKESLDVLERLAYGDPYTQSVKHHLSELEGKTNSESILNEILPFHDTEETWDTIRTQANKKIDISPNDKKEAVGTKDSENDKELESLSNIPNSVINIISESETYIRYRLWEKADRLLQSAIQIEPHCYSIRERRRHVLLTLGLFEEAAYESKEMAIIAANLKEPEDAINALKKAVELAPDKDAWSRALAYWLEQGVSSSVLEEMSLENEEDALDLSISSFIQHDAGAEDKVKHPIDVTTELFLDDTYLFEEEEPDDISISLIKELEVELAPRKYNQLLEDISQGNSLAKAYYTMGLYDDALRELEKDVRSSNFGLDSMLMMAHCRTYRNEYQEAVSLYKRILNRSRLPKDVELDALFNLGSIYLKQKNYALAKSLFNEVSDLDPKYRNQEVVSKLKECLAKN